MDCYLNIGRVLILNFNMVNSVHVKLLDRLK